MVTWQWNFSLFCTTCITCSIFLSFAPWTKEGHAAPPLHSIVVQASSPSSSLISIIDDRGKKIELKTPARRVIALYGAFNEILAALGQESRILARTKADITPPSIQRLPAIGTHMRPNVELVLSLKPDLILQATGRRQAMEPVRALERTGLKVAVFNMNSIDGLYSAMERIGILLGCQDRARAVKKEMKTRIHSIQERLPSAGQLKRPRIFFEVRYPNLLGAGGGNIVNEIIALAGGENCFSNIHKKFVRPNIEAIIKCDPDYYIIQKGPMNKEPGDPTKRPNFILIRAIREGHWVVVPEKLFSRPTPRIVEAMERLYSILHERP